MRMRTITIIWICLAFVVNISHGGQTTTMDPAGLRVYLPEVQYPDGAPSRAKKSLTLWHDAVLQKMVNKGIRVVTTEQAAFDAKAILIFRIQKAGFAVDLVDLKIDLLRNESIVGSASFDGKIEGPETEKINSAAESLVNNLVQSPNYAKLIQSGTMATNSQMQGQPPPLAFSFGKVRSDVDDLPAAKAKSTKKAYAIVIGIEQYRQKLPSADFATHDAKLVAEYLIKVMGYPEENVVTLTNDCAALGDFVKYFEKWLPNNVEKGASVFVYFSGHGAPNPKTSDAYLVPYDGDPSFIDETGYSLKRMYAALGKLPAKEIIVALDSCFSGAGGRSVIAKGSRPLVMSLQNNVVLPKNMTVLSASSGEQTSSTYDEKGHGLFTYFMLKGIKNEDVVRKDGSLDIAGLYDYVKPQVSGIARKKYNNEQTPQLIVPKKN